MTLYVLSDGRLAQELNRDQLVQDLDSNSGSVALQTSETIAVFCYRFELCFLIWS
jgi:hypothetical protein